MPELASQATRDTADSHKHHQPQAPTNLTMAAIRGLRPHWSPSLRTGASRPPHRRHATAVATALSTLCGLLLLLLAKAGHVLAAQQTPHTGVFETCPACRLNAMPELKRFLHEIVLKQAYDRLSVKFIPGMTPTLVLYGQDGNEVSREVVDANLNFAALHTWVQAKGFVKVDGGGTAAVAVAAAAAAAGGAAAQQPTAQQPMAQQPTAQQPTAQQQAGGSKAEPAPIPPAADAQVQQQQQRRRRRRRVRQTGQQQQQPGAHLQRHRRRRPRGDLVRAQDPGPGPGGAL